jgi:hypothetical protein
VSPYPPVVLLSCATTAPVQHLLGMYTAAWLMLGCVIRDAGFHLGTPAGMQVGRFSMLRKDMAVAQTGYRSANLGAKLRSPFQLPRSTYRCSRPGLPRAAVTMRLSHTAVHSSPSCSAIGSAMNAVALSPVNEGPCVYPDKYP